MRVTLMILAAGLALRCGSNGDEMTADLGAELPNEVRAEEAARGEPWLTDVPEVLSPDVSPKVRTEIVPMDARDTEMAETLPELTCPPEEVAEEICDGVDNDCDGLTDEDFGSVTCGLGPCRHSSPVCIGGKPASCNPLGGAKPEQCDGKDNDCDGAADEDFPDYDGDGEADCVDVDMDGDEVIDSQDNCPLKKNPLQGDVDVDQDSFGTDLASCRCGPEYPFTAPVPGDCQHLDPLSHPGADESCDGLDNNCDGSVDDGC